MLAQELAQEEIPFLTLSDTFDKASVWMDEFKVVELPVLENGKLMGLLTENLLFEQPNWDEEIRCLSRKLRDVFALNSEHVVEVIAKIHDSKTRLIPIITPDRTYKGVITNKQLIAVIAEMSLVKDPGGIIELEVNINDYSMSEIAQIIESDNAKLLGSYITSPSDSKKINITLKVNKTAIGGIISTFERYQYKVTARFLEEAHEDTLKDRYDLLMKYLNT